MFNKMADDEPFKPRTNQTVVSFLDHFRDQLLMPVTVFNDLCLY